MTLDKALFLKALLFAYLSFLTLWITYTLYRVGKELRNWFRKKKGPTCGSKRS